MLAYIIILLIISIYIINIVFYLYEYVNYKKEANRKIENKIWMTYLYNNVPKWKNLTLSQIAIIGTHDSATGCLRDESIFSRALISRVEINKNTRCEYIYKDFSDYLLNIKEKRKNCIDNKKNNKDKYICLLKSIPIHLLLKPFWNIVSPFVIAWTKTQKYSIINQLENGVRYFDIRLWIDKEGIYLSHGNVVFRESVAKTFFNIYLFLKNNPKEIVIIFIGHYKSILKKKEYLSRVFKLIVSIFEDILITPNEISQKKITNTSIEKLLNTGQIIFACKDVNLKNNKFSLRYKDYIYSNNLINSIWKSQNKPCVGNFKIKEPKTFPIEWKTLENQYLDCYSKVPEKRKLNVLQAHLQYNGNNVTEIVKNNLFKFTFLPSKVNLLDYTSEQQINKKLAKWLLKNANNKKININIIEVDNYNPILIKTIIKINRIKANNMNNASFSMQKD